MKMMVGTKNPAKLEAVKETLQEYPRFKDAKVVGVEVSSGVPDQPISLEDVTGGAVNRARAARDAQSDADYGIGLEAGFMKVPNSKSGYMNVSACAIYDGIETHLGLSSAFETPDKEIMRLVTEEGLNLAQAVNKTGYDVDPEVGKKSGVVGVMTKGRINRKEYVQQSLYVALAHIDD
jgi:inosine/xanthosine triphosphatase